MTLPCSPINRVKNIITGEIKQGSTEDSILKLLKIIKKRELGINVSDAETIKEITEQVKKEPTQEEDLAIQEVIDQYNLVSHITTWKSPLEYLL